MKKKLLLAAVLLLMLYLTLQSPEKTLALSRWAQDIAVKLWPGETAPCWITDLNRFRSAAHLPEYLILGFVLCSTFDKKTLWFPLLVGILIGLAEETLKIWLPTREFGLHDLIFDVIGVCLAIVVTKARRQMRTRKENYYF